MKGHFIKIKKLKLKRLINYFQFEVKNYKRFFFWKFAFQDSLVSHKQILIDMRQSFITNNVKTHLILNCFYEYLK